MEDSEIARSSCTEIKNGPKSADCDKESVDNFQKFFYELFEKNGILNDLRAYLRRHIVDVLKNSNAGDTPMCQKRFSQRLELKAQAFNILVAEYLLCSDMKYTLSVFVSEIPLANMLFDFADSLMKGDGAANLRFKDKDVWSIIQHLGIKCDSKLINKTLEMYKSEKQSLLSCIIKSLHTISVETFCVEPPATSSDEVLSEHSSDTLSEKTSKKFAKCKCQHYALCKVCHVKLMRLKDKYKRRKDNEKTKESSVISTTINSLMKNISNIEGNLVNEMFDQLKSVYESEIEMMRSKQERRVQQALKEHAQNLQQQRQELEEAFKAREADLERGVRAKKKFLWGLARTLRTQHDQLARAMIAVKYHTQQLKAKEENLMAQLSEVEHLMNNRSQDVQVNFAGELMDLQRQLDIVKRERETVNKEKAELEHLRQEISSNHADIDVSISGGPSETPVDLQKQLVDLQRQLDIVKRKRETVNKEKAELEHLRQEISSNHADIDIDEIEAVSDTAWSNLDMLKTKITTLKKLYDPSTEIKRLSEHSIATEVNRNAIEENRSDTISARSTRILNNEQEVKAVREEDRLKSNQVVNDFKKEKNVNFNASNAEGMFASTLCGAEASRPPDHALIILQQENDRLRQLARQQQEQVVQLNSRAAQLQAELSEARANRSSDLPPPITPPVQPDMPLSTNSADDPPSSALGWRCCGGGEETALLKLQPRVFIPGETVPFIGILHDRHEPRRLMNQWRCARRTSPLRSHRTPSPVPRPATTQQAPREIQTRQDLPAIPHQDLKQEEDNTPDLDSRLQHAPCTMAPCAAPPASPQWCAGVRDKSPKSVLREAKEKLRTYPNPDPVPPLPLDSSRIKSPTTVLREAKLRLRKLEIEAEAVEKSYMDYRRKQSSLRGEQDGNSAGREEALVTKDVDAPVPKNPSQNKPETQNPIKGDIHSFLQEYRRKIHLSDTQFPHSNATAAKTKPIPEAFSSVYGKKENATENYLEAPMTEFQKFYRTTGSFNKPKVTEEPDRNRRRSSLIPPHSPSSRPGSPHRLDQPTIGDSLTNEVKHLEAKKEALNKAKNSKKLELEILKQNITQMYRYDSKSKEEKTAQDSYEANSPTEEKETNLLRVEVENLKENEMKIETNPKDVLVVVQSSIEDAMSDVEKSKKLRGNMTILISPKRSPSESKPRSRSASPEQAANLTKNDVLEAIFQADPAKVISVDEVGDAALKDSEGGSEGEGQGVGEDYPDDFSADVDNYDSRTASPDPPDDAAWDDSQTYP